jgi:hypothetical protein
VTFELVPDCRADEIGTVRIEPFLNHEIDVTKVDITEIDRDFFCFGQPGSKFPDIMCHRFHHPSTILMDGIWMSLTNVQGLAPFGVGFIPGAAAKAFSSEVEQGRERLRYPRIAALAFSAA